MLTVSVENFGPIREGTVELRPLTVFVGPNNSGKSYMAMLIYAVARALALDLPWEVRWAPGSASLRSGTAAPIDIPERALAMVEEAEAREEVRAWITSHLARGNRRSDRTEEISICYADLPVPLRRALQITVEDYLDSLAESLSGEIKRCFDPELSDLSSSFAADNSFTISIANTQPRFTLRLEVSGENLVFAAKSVDLTAARWQMLPFSYPLQRLDVDAEDSRSPMLLPPFLLESAARIMQGVIPQTYYLPASRTGIIQSYKGLASSAVRQSSLAGIEDLGVTRLPAVIADFIDLMLILDDKRRARPGLGGVVGFLESEVIRGSVYLVGSEIGQSEIYYIRDGVSIRLHRTSSMVSELAPIILFIRHLMRTRDLLIIEERSRICTRQRSGPSLVRSPGCWAKNANLLLTTHSDYFIQQLSHLMQLGALSPEQRVRLGYTDADVIPVSAVGAYLFDTAGPEPGSVVKELSVTAADGIPDDQYADVSEALYNEMVNLERAAARNESRTE